MAEWIKSILHPEWYHGHGKKGPFFEGWYYKVIDAGEQHRYAVIPGVFLGKDGEHSHSFVQVLHGVSGETGYYRYPLSDFWAADDALQVRIGPNHFQLDRIQLHLEDDQHRVKGELEFSGVTSWPVTWTSPGIMGWYAWVPMMQCYHGVLGFDHAIQGALTVDGHEIDFSGGRGYIEKDWGRSFPSGWIWMQTNHFETPGTSFTGSVAHIPWLGRSFRGFIIGLWHRQHLYRFATYTGARIEYLHADANRVRLRVRNRHHRLEIDAHRATAGVLLGPDGVDMGMRVPETLDARIDVRLWQGNNLIFQDTGKYGGLEIAGDWRRLIHEPDRTDTEHVG